MKKRCAFLSNTQSHPVTSTWSITKYFTLKQINANLFRANMPLSQGDL